MQKKVLIPLLMAGTATLPALADISVGFPSSSNWTQGGTTGNQNGWSSQAQDTETLTFENVIGTGDIVTNKGLPKGRFKLTFEQTDNISVFIGGVKVEPTTANEYEFDVQTAGSVEIVIRPTKENNPCSFTGSDLILMIDGNDIATELEQLCSDIATAGFADVNADDFYPEADALREQKETLEGLAANYNESKTYEQVIDEIRSLDNGSSLNDEMLKIYNDYRLYDADNAPKAALNDLAQKQATYNDDVVAENEAWTNHENNVAKYDELKAGQESLLSNGSTALVDCAQLKAEIADWKVVDEAVKQPLLDQLAEIENKVVAYGEDLDAAFYAPGEFTDAALRTPIVFTSQEEALRAELTELQNTLKQDKSDYEVYYNVNFLLLKELEDVYENEYKATLQYPETVERDEVYNNEVYKHIFTDANGIANPLILSQSEAEKLLNDTKASCQIENVEGAAEYDKTNGCSEQIKLAIAQLREAKGNFENLVTTQDANMVAAQAEIADFEDRYALYEGFKTSLPADVSAEEYAAALETVSGQIEGLKAYVQGAYNAHQLDLADGTEYDSQRDAINGQIEELGRLAGPAAIIADLQKMLDNARANVVKVSAKEELVGLVDVASKFEGTFDALQEAINAIETEDEAYAAIQKDVQGSIAYEIQEAVWNASDMAYQFVTAKEKISYFTFGSPEYSYPIVWGLDQYKALVNDKKIVNEPISYTTEAEEGAEAIVKTKTVTVPKVEEARKTVDYSAFETAIKEYNNSLTAAANAESQESYQLINELVNNLYSATNPDGMFGEAGQLYFAMCNFAKDCTGFNKEYVEGVYAELNKKRTDAENASVTHMDEVDFSDIEAALSAAESSFTNMNQPYNLGTLLQKAPIVDGDYIKVLQEIYEQEDKIDNLVKNQEAFVRLTNSLQEAKDLLAGFRGYNDANSLEPGKEFYEGRIKDIENDINQMSVDLAEAVEAETADDDEYSHDNVVGYNEEIAEIKGRIEAEWNADKANNSFHNSQLALEKEVRTYIENLIATISANENQQGLDLVTESLDTLNGLLNNDLVLANQLMTADYGDGQSAANNETITAEYQRIKDAAIAVNDRYVNELQAAVAAANAETTAAWGLFMTELDNLYREATRSYNYFAFELKNEGWRDHVSGEIVNYHDGLFAYDGKIATLKEEEATAVNAWNKEGHVISEEEWSVWVIQYETMMTNLNYEFDTMLDAMNVLAVEYYNQEKAVADAAVADADAALTAAGIDTTEYLKAANEYIQEAEFEYWRGCQVHVQPDGDSDVSLEMDNIAYVLDQVIPSIDVQENAQDAWAKVYAEAQATIGTLREELESYGFAEPTVVAAQTKLFNDNVNNAAGVNTKAVNDQELVKNFKADCEELQGYIDNMTEAVAAVKESNDLNVENMNIYGDFINWSKEVDAELAALREYCESMAGCFSKLSTVDALQSQLDAFKSDVEQHKATLVDEDIPGRMDAFDAMVLATYDDAAAAEKDFLNNRVAEATNAYAEAYRNQGNLTDAQFAELNADIRDIDAAVDAMVFDVNDKETFRDDAVKYEKELADIYTQLQSSWAQNPTDAVLTALEGRYAAINAEIEAGEKFLANCMDEVKAKYPDAYKSYQDELNAERAEWQAEGTYVMDREPFHNVALDKIAREVSELTAQIKADEQKAQAEAEKIRVSEARYEVLKAQYDGLVEEFDDAKKKVEGYGNDIAKNLTSQANRIQAMLDQALNDLNAQRASHSLTNNSQLTNGQAIDTAIDAYVKAGANQLAGIKLNEANQARSNAMSALKPEVMVPAEFEALTAEYFEANDKLQSLLDEKNLANADRLEAIANEAAALVDTFNSIAERAQESYFKLGNVNMDEDNEVNAVDVQALINFVGEGVTYEDLYAADPRQACASDVAGNKVIDIADVTALIGMIIGDQPQMLKVMASLPAVTGNDHLTIAFMGEESGVRRYALSLTNSTEFTGAQFDIKASGNARIVGMSTAERTANHDVYMFENIDGARAVMASMQNAVFTGTEGIVMYVDVEGKGELTVSDAVFSDKNNVAHRLDKAHTSHIDALIDGVKDGAARIYDAAGRAYNRLQKGINIIRHKDGTVTKEMHK